MSTTRARALKWGALLAFLGLFFMHGAAASAAESHCGGQVIPGHTHAHVDSTISQQDLGVKSLSGTPDAAPTIAAAGIGIPANLLGSNAGETCLAILLAGFLIYILSRIRFGHRSLSAAASSACPSDDAARPPPRPTQSMLSIWRN